MTKNEHIEIGRIEKSILKKLILDNPRRPDSYSFSSIYEFFDYKTHEEQEIKDALNKLVKSKYLIFDEGFYSLTRETFLSLRQQYKLNILVNDSRFSTLVFPLLVGIIASIITMFPNFNKLFKSSKPSISSSKTDIELRINAIEQRLNNFDSLKANGINNYDSLMISKEINSLKSNFSILSDNLQSLNSLLQDNPKRFVEIATINKDLNELNKQIQSNNESIKREVDRISSYNNTLIVFMITFLVAYIGIGVFTNLSRKKSAS